MAVALCHVTLPGGVTELFGVSPSEANGINGKIVFTPSINEVVNTGGGLGVPIQYESFVKNGQWVDGDGNPGLWMARPDSTDRTFVYDARAELSYEDSRNNVGKFHIAVPAADNAILTEILAVPGPPSTFITKGDQGDQGEPGADSTVPGPAGAPGGSDPSFAAFVADSGSLTNAALGDAVDDKLGGDSTNLVDYFTRKPAGGIVTTGDVITLGSDAYAPSDVATGFVAGGAPLYENVIGGNPANVDTDTPNTTGALVLVGQNGNWNFLLGGYDNVVNGYACVVVGFHCIVHADSSHQTISGGSHHVIDGGNDYSTIGGGTRHHITGGNATIGGGRDHVATDSGTVGGGSVNLATGNASTVGGGFTNTASNGNATVGGGTGNTASGLSTTVGGGQTNTASGTGATVAGGRENVAAGNYSTAQGRNAAPSMHGEVGQSAGMFASTGDAQVRRLVARAQTTDATPTELKLDNTSQSIVIPADTVWQFDISVVGKTVGASEQNAYRLTGACKRDSKGSSTSLLGEVATLFSFETVPEWDVTVLATGGGLLTVMATGAAGKTVRWVARYDITQVTA